MRFGAERSETPNQMARETFNKVHVLQEKLFLYFSIFLLLSIHIIPIIYYILPNQGIYIYKYDVLYVIGLVHPCQVIICALRQVTCIRKVRFENENNIN